MDRRAYLKASLIGGAGLLLPLGVLGLVGHRLSPTLAPALTDPAAELIGFDGQIMGTSYSVRLAMVDREALTRSEAINTAQWQNRPWNPQSGQHWRPTSSHALQHNPSLSSLASQVHTALQAVDVSMSTWREDSEVSRLNQRRSTDWQTITAQTLRVLEQAFITSVRTQGAFDATIGPLVDLWGFGAPRSAADLASAPTTPSRASWHPPTAAAIQQALAQVDYNAIELNPKAGLIRKRNPATRLDLSGIAKGYAVDQVARTLDAVGLDNYLIEVGGELMARGLKSPGQPWKVAIERPNQAQRRAYRVLNLHNNAVATSGDYRNFLVVDSQRYCHAIDPRNGAPVNHSLASVSVIAESAMAADALSTALMIMGPTDAMAAAEQHKIAAGFILKSNGSLKAQYSRAFEPHLI